MTGHNAAPDSARHFFAAAASAVWLCGTMAAHAVGAPLQIEGVVLSPLIEAEVPARQQGLLARVAVAEGAVVEADELLASLDTRSAELAVAKAREERDQVKFRVENQIRVEFAEKSLEVAQAELRRSQESIAKFPKSISQSQLDVEALTVDKLQLERRQALHELELERYELRLQENLLQAALLELELHQMRAPFAGVVALIRARPGEWLEPGVPICRLVATDRLRAEGFVDARLVGDNDLGRRVRFVTDTGAPAAATGVLRFVSPEMDPVTGQVRVWAEIENSARRLRPGGRGVLEVLGPAAVPGRNEIQ